MVLRLDPRYPILWRTPFSLQFGADDPPVVLSSVSDVEERMLAALAIGVSRPGLDLIAKAVRQPATMTTGFLRRLAPVLEREHALRRPRVTVVGTGATAEMTARLLGEALAADGGCVSPCRGDSTEALAPTDLVVIIAHFVIEPELHGMWLRRDIAHLPVVLGDSVVTIGPVVEPGIGPCLYCLERTRTDAAPHWPALESQLWGRRSPLDKGLTAAESAAAVTRLVMARLASGVTATRATSLTLAAATGVMTRRVHSRHPECGCSVLPGISTAGEVSSVAAGTPTTTAGVGAAPW